VVGHVVSAWASQRLLVLKRVAQHALGAEPIGVAAGVERSPAAGYVEKFLAEDVAGWWHRAYRGRPAPTLAGADHEAFLEQLRAGQFRRAKEAQAWIKAQTRKELALSVPQVGRPKQRDRTGMILGASATLDRG